MIVHSILLTAYLCMRVGGAQGCLASAMGWSSTGQDVAYLNFNATSSASNVSLTKGRACPLRNVNRY